VVIAVLASAVALLVHPPVAVVTTGKPVDVVQDIRITGVKVDKPTGRYLMTTVQVDRPHLAGLIWAWALRRTVAPFESPGSRELDLETEHRSAREAFASSKRQAIALATRQARADEAGIKITIRDRDITGPSAGLIYALAIVDMLNSGDLAAGRTIAATGELRPDATIGPVAFVRLKAKEARDGGATVFLVPASQRPQARATGLTVRGAKSLGAAIRALAFY
jgi:PDZ domain-containing protein